MGFITIVTATLVFNIFLVSQRMCSKRESEREREKNKVLLMVATLSCGNAEVGQPNTDIYILLIQVECMFQ